MTSIEFENTINQSKKNKAIRFSLFASLISLVGLTLMALSIFDKVHTKAPISLFISGLFFALIGLGTFTSLKNKRKITTVRNTKSQIENIQLLMAISKNYGEQTLHLKDNYLKFEPKRKWFKTKLEIQALALDDNILLNVDAPGSSNKGIITFGVQRRNRTLILKKLKSTQHKCNFKSFG